MSRRTLKCNNIQQNVMSQTRNLKNPKKTIKPNKIQKKTPGWFFFITRVFPNPAHRRGKAWPESSLPPRRSEHCQNETCFAKERKKGQPKQGQGNSRKKQGMWKPPWEFNSRNKCLQGKIEQKWSTGLTMSMSNKILLFCYRSRNETYVKKLWKAKEML